MHYPKKILHWIKNQETGVAGGFFLKFNPATGQILGQVIKGQRSDAEKALMAASESFESWSNLSVVTRAEILRKSAVMLQERQEEAAVLVALECGKSKKSSLAEVKAATECGFFMAGEGQRFYGKILSSAVPNRHLELVRQSIGVGTLIVPFNNPLAAIAWKVFPAILCGNTVVLKAHEDTPYIAIWFAKLLKKAGLPSGVFSVVQGFGDEVGAALVEDKRARFISFTGSVATARTIIKASADRLAKVSVEAGGKNPLVICDDADLNQAANAAVASAFIDAGQRCAAGSRIIVFESVYGQFKKLFVAKVKALKVGIGDKDDFGAIINQRRTENILKIISGATERGAKLLTGGKRLTDNACRNGYFIAPTVLENVPSSDEASRVEIFGPVVILYKVKNFDEAVRLANDSEYKLTSAIHTGNLHRAQEFIRKYAGGVVRVNGTTHGSEPHVSFGGLGLSGNGWREPGEQALDFYSEWKQVSIDYDPAKT